MSCTPAALSAYNTIVAYADEGGSYIDIAELTGVTGPSMQAETIDVTTHNCTSPFRQFISGLIDPGELSLEINFIPTEVTHDPTAGLLSLLVNRTRTNFRVTWPDEVGTAWIVPGVVTSFQPSANPAEALKATVSIKVIGAPTFS